ncbi:hypothetical protein STENM327S_00216 [Streptomyces tendae]
MDHRRLKTLTLMEKTGCFQKNPLGANYGGGQLAATGRTLGIVQETG